MCALEETPCFDLALRVENTPECAVKCLSNLKCLEKVEPEKSCSYKVQQQGRVGDLAHELVSSILMLELVEANLNYFMCCLEILPVIMRHIKWK